MLTEDNNRHFCFSNNTTKASLTSYSES